VSADLLLGLFGRVAEAPGAVARLRRYVLDLAVRGFLAPMDADDPSAETLLSEILAAPRAVPLETAHRRIVDEPVSEPPFPVPKHWIWTRLGRVSDYIQRGKSPLYSANGGSPVISQKCVRWEGLDLSAARSIEVNSLNSYESYRFLRDQDLVWNSTGTGTIGRVARVKDPPANLVCDSHVTVVRCSHVVPEYVRTWLHSDHVYGRIEGDASGSTNQVELTLQMALGLPFPLPPLPEQRRIVMNVDKLLALCDQLEAAQRDREVRRDTLRAATLQRLALRDDSAESSADVRFFVGQPSLLVTKPEHLAVLRQTILDLAVRGRLVTPDVTVGEQTNRADDSASIPGPFPLPRTWRWHTVAQIGTSRLGKMLDKAKNRGAPHRYLRNANVRWFDFELSELKTMLFEDSELAEFALQKGDVLICEGGEPGRAAVWDGRQPDIYFQKAIHRVRLHKWILPEFFVVYLRVRAYVGGLVSHSTGATFQHLTGQGLASLPVPIPPLPEQHRIVAKVRELMAVCDGLEAALISAQGSRARLLEALVHQALQGAAVPFGAGVGAG
jgi:type I restriction enzyme S subunit